MAHDLRIGIGQLASELLATNLNLATLLPSATSIPNSIRCRFADCSLDLNALAYTLGLCAILLCWLDSNSVHACRRLRGRVGGDTQPRPITSPDRPGLPDFSRETLKNMGRPGYEATTNTCTSKVICCRVVVSERLR